MDTSDREFNEALPQAPALGEVAIGGRRYVTAEHLAELLGKSPRTVGRWNSARIGPPRIRVGRLILFDVARLQDWLAAHETEPVASPAYASRAKSRKFGR
jgi:hypothetical protein